MAYSMRRVCSLIHNLHNLWVIQTTTQWRCHCRTLRSALGIYSYHSLFGRTRPKARVRWRQEWQTEPLSEVVDLVALCFGLIAQRCAFLFPDTERVLEAPSIPMGGGIALHPPTGQQSFRSCPRDTGPTRRSGTCMSKPEAAATHTPSRARPSPATRTRSITGLPSGCGALSGSVSTSSNVPPWCTGFAELIQGGVIDGTALGLWGSFVVGFALVLGLAGASGVGHRYVS
jgi:hypothetical protein